MLWARRYDAFISYSHKDNDVVKPLVELLSVNEHRVFWDQHLKAGDRWDQVIRSAVKQSSVFVLFWCCDTRGSQYVAEEIALALRLKKKIVPVKLCSAAMPPPLGEWQWIDLGQRVQHLCTNVDHQLCSTLESSVQLQARSVSWNRAVWLSFATAVLLLISISSMMLLHKSAVPKTGSILSPLQSVLVERISRIPRGAVRLPNGYAVVNAPEGAKDGSIMVLDKLGEVVARYTIPLGPPPLVLPEPHEVALPWWYTNRAILILGSFFAATIALFTWMIMSRRRRASYTLNMTMDYLRPLAHDN
jgi:hypothetical protein